jgi:hypothetical protein
MIHDLRGAMICVGIAVFLAACNFPLPSLTPGAVTNPTLHLVPTATPAVITPSPAPSATPLASEQPARTRYEFDVLLDTASKKAEVDERIVFANPSSKPLSEIMLVVSPNGTPGVFTLNSVKWGDGSELQNYQLKGETLTIPLPGDLDVGQEGQILLSYQLDLPGGKGWLNDTGSQINFGDWYPFLPVFKEEVGWMTHSRAKVGDHLVYDLADYEVTLRLSSPDPGLVLAASAPAERTDNGWHYSLPAARSFAFSASNQFNVSETYSNGIQILSYSFPEHTGQGEVARDAAGDALSLYEDRYGQYPHPSLSVVEADFPDGMEFDGLFFLGESYFRQYEGDPLSYLIAIAAHETAHQWFYGIIGNDPALQPWLDEALATYSELLYYERFYPEIASDWWSFRVDSYSPQGGVDSTIYDFGGFRPYVNAVYLRGAQFLDDLREVVGDEVFYTFLRDYAEQGRQRSPGSLSSTSDFFEILANHTNKDISDLLREYFANVLP